jgi:hypothetical protein
MNHSAAPQAAGNQIDHPPVLTRRDRDKNLVGVTILNSQIEKDFLSRLRLKMISQSTDRSDEFFRVIPHRPGFRTGIPARNAY